MPSLRRMPRLTYANAISTLALFIALGGGAYAASGGFTSTTGAVRFCVARNGSASIVRAGRKCGRRQTTLILNQKGVSGARGPAGTRGAQGPQGPVGPLTGAAGGDLTGKYPNPFIGDGKIITSRLAEAAVTNPKLAGDAVTSAKIQDGQVRAGDLGAILEVTKSVSAAEHAAAGVAVECPANTKVISGGFQASVQGVIPAASRRFENGWEYNAKNEATGTAILTAIAYCLEA
jgi:hypothetical protein